MMGIVQAIRPAATPSVLLALLVGVLVGAWHQDVRKLASGDAAFRAFHDGTPFFLFTGRETLRGLRELPPVAIGAGLALGLGARWLHGSLW